WENFYAVDAIPEEKTTEPPAELIEQEQQVEQYIFRSPYIITPTKSGLMLIHARRAYERIVYDALHTEFITHPIPYQTLLFPYEKEISSNEASVWKEHATILNRLGFSGQPENDQLVLHAVPAVL